MNFRIIVFFLLLLGQSILAQTASIYFPSQTGYKWNYEYIPLDSLNNQIDSLKYYGIDSFAVISQFNGKTANIVLTKTGTQNSINILPFLDSLYYNFDNSNGFEYFNPRLVSGLIGNIDTTLGISFLNIFKSLEGWYSYFSCLLYTSDAADERSSVDLGGRRIIKKKNKIKNDNGYHRRKKNK